MRHMKLINVDINIVSSPKNKVAVAKSFRDTLTYCIEELIDRYHTPDDVTFSIAVEGRLSYSEIDVRVLFNTVKDLKTIKHFGENITLETYFTYRNSEELSFKLTDDLLKVLGRFGLTSLYNQTNKRITVRKN